MHGHLSHSHNIPLVAISVAMGIFASYSSLEILSNISKSDGKLRYIWFGSAVTTFGLGIWAMHFIGMMAFEIKGVEINYDVPLMLLSIVAAIIGSGLGVFIISMKNKTILANLMGAVAMGLTISSMHYIGIWSMRMPMRIVWDYNFVVLSVLMGILASFFAIVIGAGMNSNDVGNNLSRRILSGIIMGLAISSMHYTGMMGMSFTHTDQLMEISKYMIGSQELMYSVIFGTLVILSVALVASSVERSMSQKNFVNESLRHAVESRDDFMSLASHELKTPLTSMKLQIQIISKKLELEQIDVEQFTKLIHKSDESLNRMKRVVDDMFDISQASRDNLDLSKQSFDLGALVHEVMERMAPVAERNNNIIEIKISEKICGNWDKFRIDQVITNLLSNAIKYAPGSKIVITIWKEEDTVFISVQDFGMGIPPENLSNIFDRYIRGNNVDHQGGLGIGLYISKQIIEKHGGEITVRSKVKVGSMFTVKLPLRIV